MRGCEARTQGAPVLIANTGATEDAGSRRAAHLRRLNTLCRKGLSNMDSFLLSGRERRETLEQDVDVLERVAEVED
jgi:hypothetical protein